MARRRYGGTVTQLTPEEREALEAQTNLTGAQAQALADEAAYRRGQLAIEQGKLNLGGRELTDKEKQSKRETAAKLLGFNSALDVERLRSQSDVTGDILRNPAITPSQAASTLAGMGNPALYNALASEKAAGLDKAIATFIPQLQSAKSDEERIKKYKPALEALGPGTYDVALARAFPKGNVSMTTTPETFKGPTTSPTGAPGFGELASRLLEGGETAPAQAGRIPRPTYSVGSFGGNPPLDVTLPPLTYTLPGVNADVRALSDPSVGALEGSRRTDLASGLTSLATPSGGEIRFKTPQGERANATLARYIGPQTSNVVSNPPPNETMYPTPIGATLGKLVTGSAATPGPAPTPGLFDQIYRAAQGQPSGNRVFDAANAIPGTPSPLPNPGLTPEMLAELRRRAAQR